MLAAICFAAVLSLVAAACWSRAADPADARLDPALRRVVAENPDSDVGLLIRTSGRPTAEQLTALTELGIAVGSVIDTIVTGRAPARAAAAAAALDFVVYIQLAATLHPTGR